MTKEKLHWLIALEVGLVLISFKMSWFGVDYIGLDETLRNWVVSEQERELSEREWILAYVAFGVLLLVIFSWIWLWMLKPYSRILYTLLAVSGFIFIPFMGVRVSNGWIDCIDGLATIITGMIIAVLYFTDVYSKEQSATEDADPKL